MGRSRPGPSRRGYWWGGRDRSNSQGIDVVDHGVGIPEGEEELIFEEFHRGPQEGRSAGTGLGLALTRRIVGLHGGQMKALRNPEGGSTFTFTLPEG